jgi:predicted DNA-binding transcriptional regulator AlpA
MHTEIRIMSEPNRQPNRVLTLRQWADLNSLGYRTACRLLASGEGPKVIQLTERRIGIREADNEKWQQARLQARARGRA